MAPIASGRIVLWEGASLWLLQVADQPATDRTDCHAHHAIQVTLALDQSFELYGGSGRVEGPAAAVAPDARHAFSARGAVALLFIAPESRVGEALSHRLFAEAPIAPLPLATLGDLPSRLLAQCRAGRRDDEAARALGRAMVEALGGGAGGRRGARVARPADPPSHRRGIGGAGRSLERLRGRQAGRAVARPHEPSVRGRDRAAVPDLPLVDAADQGGGAVRRRGAPDDAAHEAGFADQAHLSRTFRRMFGVAASGLQMA